MADDILKTVLLLALPASGKSEVRRYLAQLPADVCGRDFHMGATVQLDDFPYVHMMRRIDDELDALGRSRVFFRSPERPFRDARDWGTLIHLVNWDYADLVARRVTKPVSAASLLLERLDDAAAAVGLPTRLARLDVMTRMRLADLLEREARAMLDEKHASYPESLDGKTVVIEFARGGPHGASMPLPAPLGYRYSVAQLSDAILAEAAILYVWTTPGESRRKNAARTNPNDPGSILHHGVPIEVLMNDYGCDDMDFLEEDAAQPGTVTIETRGRTWQIPIARFDNRVDKTSFLRDAPASWKPGDVTAVHEGLRAALSQLAAFSR